jgi:hypothetical protein
MIRPKNLLQICLLAVKNKIINPESIIYFFSFTVKKIMAPTFLVCSIAHESWVMITQSSQNLPGGLELREWEGPEGESTTRSSSESGTRKTWKKEWGLRTDWGTADLAIKSAGPSESTRNQPVPYRHIPREPLSLSIQPHRHRHRQSFTISHNYTEPDPLPRSTVQRST